MADQLIGYQLDTSYHTRSHVRLNDAETGSFRTEAIDRAMAHQLVPY